MADKKIRPAKKVKRDSSWQDRLFGAVVIILSIFVFVVIAYPLWFIIIASISNSNLVNLGKVTIWPKDILFYGYQRRMRVSGPVMPIPYSMWWREPS